VVPPRKGKEGSREERKEGGRVTMEGIVREEGRIDSPNF